MDLTEHIEGIRRHSRGINTNITSFISETDTEEALMKSVDEGRIEMFDASAIDGFLSDVKKEISTLDEVDSRKVLEKAKKDLSKLTKKVVTDKRGHRKTVYTKTVDIDANHGHPSDDHARAVELYKNKKKYMSKDKARAHVERHIGKEHADYAHQQVANEKHKDDKKKSDKSNMGEIKIGDKFNGRGQFSGDTVTVTGISDTKSGKIYTVVDGNNLPYKMSDSQILYQRGDSERQDFKKFAETTWNKHSDKNKSGKSSKATNDLADSGVAKKKDTDDSDGAGNDNTEANDNRYKDISSYLQKRGITKEITGAELKKVAKESGYSAGDIAFVLSPDNSFTVAGSNPAKAHSGGTLSAEALSHIETKYGKSKPINTHPIMDIHGRGVYVYGKEGDNLVVKQGSSGLTLLTPERATSSGVNVGIHISKLSKKLKSLNTTISNSNPKDHKGGKAIASAKHDKSIVESDIKSLKSLV